MFGPLMTVATDEGQLSVTIGIGTVTFAPQIPGSLSCVILLGQVMAGAIVSSTVTVAVQVAVFPASSVTVSTTVFDPIFAQEKVSISKLREIFPSGSLLPLFISLGRIVTIPEASKEAVMF